MMMFLSYITYVLELFLGNLHVFESVLKQISRGLRDKASVLVIANHVNAAGDW